MTVVGLVVMALAAPRPNLAEPTPVPDATVTLSRSPMASGLGLTMVEGVLRFRGKTYLVAVRGAQPTTDTRGSVYHLRAAREIEGVYKPGDEGLRNDRGVTIVFDPLLDLPGGQLQVDLSSRVYPKASTGQRGTVD